MSDLFQEMFQTINSRLRSPTIGSVILAFVGFNWRALMYLFFASTDVQSRIIFFDNNTYWWSLLAPIPVGFAAAWLAPRIKDLGAMMTEAPKKRTRSREMELENF